MDTTLTNFSKHLLNFIESDNHKPKVILAINKYKDDINKKEEIDNINKTHYDINYKNPRIEQDFLYNKYFEERSELFNQWLNSKLIKDLYELVKVSPPVLNYIPEIYTYNYKKEK